MAQLAINTQDYRDLYETMQSIYHILEYNKKDLEFCPIEQYTKLKEKYSEVEKNYRICSEELDSTKKKLKDEIEKNNSWESIKAGYIQEIEELKAKNKEMENNCLKAREELEKYNINLSDPSSETIFLEVIDNALKPTYIENRAFYIGVRRDNVYEFCYNEAKAQHQKAIAAIPTILEPYCDIEGVMPSDATKVENRGKGILKIDEKDCFIIEKRAKVRLVK